MSYNVIGNIVDEENKPLVGVLVDDGSIGTSTDSNGYYEITTNKKSLNYRLIGFNNQTFDLTKYPDGSSVNVDIKMTINPSDLKTLSIEEDALVKKLPLAIPTALVLAISTYFVAKKYTSSMPIIIGSAIALGVGGYFGGLKLSDIISKAKKKK